MLTLFCLLVAADLPPPQPTTTVIETRPEATVYGEPMSIAVRVSGTVRTPLGTVEVFDNDVLVGGFTLAAGAGTLELSTLEVGEHRLSARYTSSDPTRSQDSESYVIEHPVERGASMTIVRNEVTESGEATFYMTVSAATPSRGTPTGEVTVYLDADAIATATLVDGTATVHTEQLAIGDRSASVTYAGDSHYLPNVSSQGTVTVLSEAFSVAIDPPTAKLAAGDDADFTLTIAPELTRNGPVHFTCTNLPAGATCSFTPETIVLGEMPAAITVHMQTNGDLFAAGLLVAIGMMVAGRKRRVRAIALLACAFACADARESVYYRVRVVAVSENIARPAEILIELR